ncbi:MAG: YhgN family NAAT transporter [Rudaea sp.]|uniref:YhgN family NAAT transporter n=1 Tax=unclassified Rudaea TaxID=2627037 RepID=UPI0010F9F270|nr:MULTISPECIES: YhgN family NAAT transporter [unclassified Rudaea]MBN8884564.1 YhgN family NAAT transporter [Rudaea sp.]MBR0346535.1 YhgN family NAAT transporter [Rudaea sp.]
MGTSITTLSAGIMLFLILDPLGNIPIFLSLLKNVAPERRRYVLMRELVIALVTLFVILFCGSYVLKLMQLRIESVSIAGGIVLFLIGVKMVFPPREGGVFGDAGAGEPFIVPMAIPGVAGPSAMAALMLMANSQPGRTADWSIALFCAWLATALILLSSTYLFRLLGHSVLTAIERLVGMLLVALSVQMFLDGLTAYVKLS